MIVGQCPVGSEVELYSWKGKMIGHATSMDGLIPSPTRILVHTHDPAIVYGFHSDIGGVTFEVNPQTGGTMLGWTYDPAHFTGRWSVPTYERKKHSIPNDIKYGYWVPSDMDIVHDYITKGTGDVGNAVSVVAPVIVKCRGKYCPDPYNPYAQPNQPDGSHLCWSCRHQPSYMRGTDT